MDNHSSFRYLKGLVILAISASLIACGGSNSANNNSNTNNAIPADFDLFAQTGTWRLDIDAALDNLVFSLDFDGQTITSTTDTDLSILTVGTLAENGNQVTSDICDVTPAVTLDQTDFTDSSIADLTDDLDLGCTPSVTYTRNSASSYQISATCGADFTMSMNFTRLADTATLDYGGLSFTSSQYADLNSPDDACGTITNAITSITITPQPNALNEPDRTENRSIVQIVAPYAGNRISFEFALSANPVQTGTYTVVAGIANPNEAEVFLDSVIFGGTPDNPASVAVQSGSVTITSASQFGVSGTFNLATQFNGTFDGTFNFNLQ